MDDERAATGALLEREDELRELTADWTVSNLVRRYGADPAEAEEDFLDDRALLSSRGYVASSTVDRGSATFQLSRSAGASAPLRGASRTERYFGKYPNAVLDFEADAATLADEYWFPTVQTYIPGTWSGGAWVLAFLALVVLVGMLVLAYMIVVRPAGELHVTYEYRPRARAVGGHQPTKTRRMVPRRRPEPARGPSGGVAAADEIRKLAGLRAEGILTEAEFAAKKRQLLGL